MFHAIAAVIGFFLVVEGYWSLEEHHPNAAHALIVVLVCYGLYAAAKAGKGRNK